MLPSKLLLITCGNTYDDIAASHGDFDAWFKSALREDAGIFVCEAHRGEALPSPGDYDGVIISGSPSSVTEWTPWMERTARFIQACAAQDVPLLGVCFGHQLMGRAMGGRVALNPAGREIGTVEVMLTKAGSTDPVLGPLVPSFRIQATHVDSVVEPPPGAEILARTLQENCAAMRIGRNLYGVQFHPEMNASLMRRYITHRQKLIDQERGPGTADRIYQGVQDTRAGEAILKRFVSEIVVPHRRMAGTRRAAPAVQMPSEGSYREAYVPAADGHDIFYNEVGLGSPTLMMMDGIGCDQYAWKYLVEHLRQHHHIIRWNYPGHGRTPPPRGWPDTTSERLTLHGLADDAIRVLDHAGVDKAVLCGHSLGVQLALETWSRHRDRVLGLVLVCGSYGRPLKTFHGRALMERLLPRIQRTFQRHPWFTRVAWKTLLDSELAYQVAVRTEANGALIKRDDFIPYFRHIAGVDPLLFVEMLSHASGHSAEGFLPQINVPTLIVAGEQDTFTPAQLSQHMHSTIPGSELLHVPAGTHTAPLEIPELVTLRVEKFLRTRLAQNALGTSRAAREAQLDDSVNAWT